MMIKFLNIFYVIIKSLKIKKLRGSVRVDFLQNPTHSTYHASNKKNLSILKFGRKIVLVCPLYTKNLPYLAFFAISPIYIGKIRRISASTIYIDGLLLPNLIAYFPFLIVIIASIFAFFAVMASILVNLDTNKVMSIIVMFIFITCFCGFFAKFLDSNYFAYFEAIESMFSNKVGKGDGGQEEGIQET